MDNLVVSYLRKFRSCQNLLYRRRRPCIVSISMSTCSSATLAATQ